MVQTNNVAYARFMYSNSWLIYLATTIADCSTPLAELKLDVAIELLKNENQMTNI